MYKYVRNFEGNIKSIHPNSILAYLCNMHFMKKIVFFICFHSIIMVANAQWHSATNQLKTGADQTTEYFPSLKGKKVGVFANPTSMIGNTHLVDTLVKSGIEVTTIFGPEHGFRGKADAGEHINNGIDSKTGISVISLYGNHKKPTPKDFKGLDILLFDIQDVGVRFYTYISSLQYFMEAALENNMPLIILDRPNPNGFYVDGPVLDPAYKSFVGMQPVPVVYGMTIGEYARMLLGEKWLSLPKKYHPEIISVITCKGYDHATLYQLPVYPSPNLRSMQAIYLYPSVCFFEGSLMSEGRGTDMPFQIYGHPQLPDTLFSFTPKPNEGAKNSKCFYKKCYGWKLDGSTDEILKKWGGKIQLSFVLDAYRLFPGKDSFFLKDLFFDKLAGNAVLREQIKKGMSEEKIRATWQPALNRFKLIRKKYLLYKDCVKE